MNFGRLGKLWVPERERPAPPSPVGKMLCQVTGDNGEAPEKFYFPLPEYVRLMKREQRRDWMRSHGVVPVLQGAAYSMFEMFQPWAVSPAGSSFTAVTAAALTALTPDTLFTLPANIFSFVGKRLWLHASGVLSTTSAAQTYAFGLYWGGIAGTKIQGTGAIIPWAVTNTNTLWYADFWIVARATGALTTSLTLNAHGQVQGPTFSNTTTQATNATQLQYAPSNSATPGTALADVASLNGTVAEALTLAVTPSAATGSIAVVDAWVCAMN